MNTKRECVQCGAILDKEANFCSQCGAKVMMATKKVVIREKEQQNYGETLGTEYYSYFGGFNSRGRAMVPDQERVQYQHRYAFYDQKYYYQKNIEGKNYLLRSNADGTEREVIRETEGVFDCVYVNKTGIFICSMKKITVYDFKGNERASLEPYDEMISYYVCESRIYTITKDREIGTYIASWFDVDEKVMHNITAAGVTELGINSRGERSYQEVTMNHIMANNRRVVIWMEFICYSYPENEGNIVEGETGGWYSYDFQRKKLTSINSTHIYPHQVLNPSQYNQRDWNMAEERNEWIPIAFFDMKRDLVWVKRILNDGSREEMWEARRIGEAMHQSNSMNKMVWNAGNRMQAEGHYFDGEVRYMACGTFAAYKRTGEKCEWYGHGYYDSFVVAGGYLFLDLETLQEEQYHLNCVYSEPLRESWMAASRNGRTSEEDKRSVESFNNRSSERKKTVLSCSKDGKQNLDVKEGKITKLSYWEGFAEYAFGNPDHTEFDRAGILKSVLADRNWYALRAGISKIRIELSFNTRKNTIRTALFFDDKKLYNILTQMDKALINGYWENIEGAIVWDGTSKSSSISIVKEHSSINSNRMEQYEWFVKCSCVFKELALMLQSA